MKYNLAKYAQLTSSGTVILSLSELIDINDSIGAGIAVSSGTLYIDCDLGSRVHLDQIRYYTTGSGVTASNISFYYKNESFESFTGLTTYDSGSYFYTTMSGYSAPRYIKIKHIITSSSGTFVNGLVIQNNENYVDFGENGDRTAYNINTSIENESSQINTVAVYNSSSKLASAKVFIEPQNSAIDDMLFISDSASGPWYGVYRDEDKVAGSSLWNTGTTDNTEIVSNVLKLESGSIEGTFTTRIVKLDELQKLTFAIIDREYSNRSQAVEFQDSFSTTTNSDWYIYTGNSNTLYFNGSRMELQYGNFDIRSVGTFEFSDDWYFKCRCDITSSQGWDWDLYLAGNKVRLRFDTGYDYVQNYNVYLYINGTQKWANTDTLDVRDNFINIGYFWIVIQREFNIVRFKHWIDGDSEPGTWNFEGSINPNDINTTGYIRFYTGQNSGSYSRDVYVDDVSLIKYYTSLGTGIGFLSVDPTDTHETIEIRSSNIRPMDKDSYIYYTGSWGSHLSWCNYRFLEDSSYDEQSPSWTPGPNEYGCWAEIFHDSASKDEYILKKGTNYGGGSTVAALTRRNNAATTTSTDISISSARLFWNTYKLSFNTNGGFWIYYYVSTVTSNTSGDYYLRYCNSAGTLIYSRQQPSENGNFIYDIDAVYDSDGDLWYTDVEMNAVVKLDREGNIIIVKPETDEIRGIVALDDGTCWYIRAGELVHMDSSATEIETITLPSDTISYVYKDLDGDGFWLHDGDTIRFIYNNGNEKFNIVRSAALISIQPCHSGVLATEWNGDPNVRAQGIYISKDYERVVNTFNFPRDWELADSYNNMGSGEILGIRTHVYDDLTEDFASNFPITIDTNWNNTEWKKVSLRDYNLSNEEYHQLRITLRASSSSDSPEVYGIWFQRAVELPNILPGNYANFYLKTDTSLLTNEDIGSYTSNIRAWWFAEEN